VEHDEELERFKAEIPEDDGRPKRRTRKPAALRLSAPFKSADGLTTYVTINDQGTRRRGKAAMKAAKRAKMKAHRAAIE